ncbi:MAG: hypothetical protein DCC73_13915 [Proteobacteria bacterium]|nr:MAG: hypothetical protein DCC73_13915 [Pseudomonadota bacterium]
MSEKDIEAIELRCAWLIRGANDDLQAMIDHLRSGDPISQLLRDDLANALDPNNKITAVHFKKTYRERGFVKKRQGLFRFFRGFLAAERATELKQSTRWKMNEAIIPHVVGETGASRTEIYEGLAVRKEWEARDEKLRHLAGGNLKNITLGDLVAYEDGRISEDELKRRCAERSKQTKT